jgi:hypothetical protein
MFPLSLKVPGFPMTGCPDEPIAPRLLDYARFRRFRAIPAILLLRVPSCPCVVNGFAFFNFGNRGNFGNSFVRITCVTFRPGRIQPTPSYNV